VPVLAASAASAIGGAVGWRAGLSQKPREATAFYGVLAGATLSAVGITLAPVDPIQALYWSAVINGIIAAPVMIVMMLIGSRRDVMGRVAVTGWLLGLGWTATAVMALCVAAMAATWLV
jgi:Mn2+/Fe2+ NRAMP family transporter